MFNAEMPTLTWDQNYLKSLDILTHGEGDDSVKIWRQNTTTGIVFTSPLRIPNPFPGLSLSRLLLCTLSPRFKQMLQEICPCHSVSLVLPDNHNNTLEENSNDLLNDVLNSFLTSPTSTSSKPLTLGNTCNNNLGKEAEVVMITGGVRSLIIDDQPEHRSCSGESSDEDIFLTDDEEVDEAILVQSPIVGNKLKAKSTEDSILSECFSEDSNHERVDKNLECDLDGDADESLCQQSSSVISSIIEDLIQFVVTAKNESYNFEHDNISGEESFGECGEEGECEDDENSDLFVSESESEDDDESCSDPSWKADDSENDEEEEDKPEDLRIKSLKAVNKNRSLFKERLDSSSMDSGNLSFFMSETGPIAIQVMNNIS